MKRACRRRCFTPRRGIRPSGLSGSLSWAPTERWPTGFPTATTLRRRLFVGVDPRLGVGVRRRGERCLVGGVGMEHMVKPKRGRAREFGLVREIAL